ncbi:MAG: hypothetical protein FWF13_04570, partial [Acidobacteria bacterium]|nr:hypothetical protein [Acidobacteriota bacterium]
MTKRRGRGAIRILAAGAIFIVLVACLFLTPPIKRLTFNFLCRYLDSATGIRVEASSVGLDYFRGRAEFENLTIRSSSALELPPFFRVEHAAMTLDILKIIRGKIVIEEITLTRPEIYYFIDGDGKDNLPVLPSSEDGAGTMPDILIARVEIRDSVFRYDDTPSRLFIELPDWNLDVTGDAQMHLHRIVFENRTDAELRYEDVVLPVKSLMFDGSLDLEGNGFEISSARIAADGFSADITGNINFSGPSSRPSIDVTIQTTAELRQAAELAAMELPIGGKLSGEIRASGNFDSLDISTRLGISDFKFHSYTQDALELSLKGNWLIDSERLIFPEIAVLSPEGTIAGKADIAVPGTSGINTITAEFKNLDVRPLVKLADAPLDIASHGAGSVSLEWEGDFDLDKATATALVTFTADIAEPEAGVLPFSGSLNASLKNNQLEIMVPEMNALDFEASGRFTLENFQNIEGKFEGTNADIGPTIPGIARFFDAGELPLAAGELGGSLSFHLLAAGSINQPEISASLDMPELSFKKLKISSRSDLLFRDGTLDFSGDFGLPQNSAAALKGTLNFSGDDPVIAVTAQAEYVPVAIVSDILDLEIPLSGVFDASVELGGQVENLEGNAVISVSDLALYEKPLGRVDAEINFLNMEIRSEKFLLWRDPENPEISEDPENFLTAQFSYDLDSGRFGLIADGKDLTLSGWNLPERIPVPGKINLKISGEGTIDQPRVEARMDADDMKMKYNGEETSLGPVSIIADIVSEDARITANAPRLNLSAEARGRLSAPYPFTGELRTENSDLSVIGLKILREELPFGGAIDAVIRAAGNLENPERTEIDADIHNMVLRAQPHEARLFSPTRLMYRDGVLEITNPALLVTRSSEFEISGRIPIFETAFEETLKLRGRVGLAEALSFTPASEDIDIEGILTFDVDVNVLDGVYGGRGEIAMERGRANIPGLPLPFEAININANVENGALILRNASAGWGGGTISITGELPFRALPWNIPGVIARDGPVQFALAVRDMTPEMTGLFPSGLIGKVSLRAEGNAERADLESLRAEIIFDDLGFKVDTLTFHQQAPARIDISDGRATISSLNIIGPETNLRFGGSAGLLSSEAPLDLRLEGFFDAAVLTVGDPDLRAAGRFDIRIAAGGTISEPALSGYAETNNGRFSLRDPRIVADDLHIRLAVTPEEITVEHLTGLLNGGSLTGEGALGYDRGLLNDIDLRVSFNNCFLEAPKGLKSASSGTIIIASKEDTIE